MHTNNGTHIDIENDYKHQHSVSKGIFSQTDNGTHIDIDNDFIIDHETSPITKRLVIGY